MLAYARTLVGRPFSNTGMVRSIIYPRQTDEKSFFCAGARSLVSNKRVDALARRRADA